ncbi:hypothetical protein CB1_001141010 [Camelus ferus]|nr:hypothetical protein CB1_001141010 [Camelus ferus]
MFGKLMTIAKNLPDPGKAQDFVKKFNQVLGDDEKLRSQLELLISPTCSCKQADVCVREIARKLANPKQPTNPFLEMVKFLLERIAPVHIDSEAISALVKLMNKSIEGTADDEEEGVSPDTAIRSGLELLKPLSRSLNADVPEQLITPLVSLGHISMLAPDQFASPMKSVVANFIVKDLLMNDRVQAIKLLVRWLLGMKNNQSKSANSTLRLLSAMLVSEGDLTEQKRISKSDMSRLRLAAGSAIMKLAQEPCYHEIITPEQFQLCALVINDECYQVRQIFAQKLHKALVKLLLPLEYMAIFALCAKDPVKERRAHARQCLLKNISIRREYIKQNPMATEKLLSLLPEYVVPYMIHLLAHDPDFTRSQDVDQLRDIKEEQSSEAAETGVSENEENPVRIISVTPVKNIDPVKTKEINSDQVAQGNISSDRGKKRTVTAAGAENIQQKPDEKVDESGPPAPSKPRRGRRPKSESQGNATKNDDINKPLSKGRKRAAVSQESPGGLEAGNAKAPKLQDIAKKAAPAERQIDLQRFWSQSAYLHKDSNATFKIPDCYSDLTSIN